jgi:hypothetical protein
MVFYAAIDGDELERRCGWSGNRTHIYPLKVVGDSHLGLVSVVKRS